MTAKSSNIIFIPAAIVLATTAFVAGVYVKDSSQHVTSAHSCVVHLDASNVDGNITTKVNADGSQESCEALLNQLRTYSSESAVAGFSEDSEDSGADAASSPSAASQ